ncbi:MAG TPA: glycosyltransferase family 2 protein [Candidatus Microsaccharimonas sp.]|jgi:glycosyltransferase involved in cell wall biosynthesis
MNVYIVGKLLETGTLVLLGVCFLLIITGSFYDIWMTRRRKVIDLQTRRLRRNRPHVTVLVYAKNSAAVVSDCLASILKNRSRQYDIVVVNNKSTDQTRMRLAQFQRDHPIARLYVYNKRKADTVHTSLQQAYRKSQQGAIVLTIRSDSIFSKTFIKEAVAHFKALGGSYSNEALLFSESLSSSQNFMATLRHFPLTSRQLLRKVASLLKIGRLPTGISNAMYESTVLMNKDPSLRTRYVYDSHLSVRVAPTFQLLFPKRTFKELALFYLVGISLILYVSYSMYMAATLQNTALLLFGWLVVVVWFFAAIWSDEALRRADKLRFSFVLPSLYFFLYVMTTIEVIVRCVGQLVMALRMVLRGITLFYLSQPPPLEE